MDEVIPLVQFGPALSITHCDYDEYPLNEFTTVRIQKYVCLFLNADGAVQFEIHTTAYRFTMFGAEMKLVIGALIDQGANACLTGADQRVFCTYNRRVNVGGIADNNLNGLQIVDSGGKAQTQRGPVICIFFQSAWDGKDKSIISVPQCEHNGIKVYNKSIRVGGL